MPKTILDTKLFRIQKDVRSLNLWKTVERTNRETGETYTDWEFVGYYGRLELLVKYLLQIEITRDGKPVALDGLSKEVKDAEKRLLKAIEEAINA